MASTPSRFCYLRVLTSILARSAVCIAVSAGLLAFAFQDSRSAIRFVLQTLPFRLENDQTSSRNAPETMPGGVAILDYNQDGRPDIFFTNGADIATLTKNSPKYRNGLFRNDGNGAFTDVTEAAGLAGTGYA